MPTCQGQHPDGSPCRNPAPPGRTYCYIHGPGPRRAPLTRKDVLKAIEERGRSSGLDLSHEDLTNIDLGSEAIQNELGAPSPLTSFTPWYSQGVKGANLQGASLEGATLRWANLHRANLGVANLNGSDLWGANLQEANFRGTKLQEDWLKEARLERLDLAVASDIRGIYWGHAVLDKTRMRREQLGEKIGDELAAEKGNGTYDQAREAYLALKTNFNELGRYDDASWAYRQERRMERAMSWPGRAAREHPKEKNRLAEKHRRVGKPWFYIKHTLKWLWDGAVALLTDCGESPGRVLAWAAFLLLVAYPLIYWWCAGRPAPAGNLLAFVKDYLLLSLGAFSTLDLVDLSAARFSNWTRLWAATEAMAGISLLALLMFTLGNRISRS